ncbi:MAG: hypothetical protein ACOYON_00830 [Fimbriimonas sp.]
MPSWLFGVKVDFVCNNCPNRQTKNIAFVSLEPTVPKAAPVDEPEIDEEDPDDLDI